MLAALLVVISPAATGAESSDILCVNSLEVVGFEPDAATRLTESIIAALSSQGVTARFSAQSAPDDDACAPPALGVVHIQVLRAGNSVHLSLRAIGRDRDSASEVTKIETQRPRALEQVNIDTELFKIVAILRDQPVASTPAPTMAMAAPASEPQPQPGFVTRVGVAPLALCAGGALSLIVAGAFEIDAYNHQKALDNGDYAANRQAGVRSQNVARVIGAVGLLAVAAGVVLYLVHDDTAATVAGDGGQVVVLRF